MTEYDLIDRDKIFEKVTELYRYSRGDVHIAYRELLTYILDMPTVDVKSMEHGEWKYYKNNDIYYVFKCTNCNKDIELELCELNEDDMPDGWHFCPNCGARMDSKEGDTNG